MTVVIRSKLSGKYGGVLSSRINDYSRHALRDIQRCDNRLDGKVPLQHPLRTSKLTKISAKTLTSNYLLRLVYNSLQYVTWKDYKAVTADLKKIYKSVTEEEALLELEKLSDRWDDKYPQVSR